MKRRGFLSSLAALPLLKIAPEPEKCKLCGQFGHQQKIGVLRLKTVEDVMWSGNGIDARWCPNRPVDWDFYEEDAPR